MDDIVDEDIAFGAEGISAFWASISPDGTDTFGNVES